MAQPWTFLRWDRFDLEINYTYSTVFTTPQILYDFYKLLNFLSVSSIGVKIFFLVFKSYKRMSDFCVIDELMEKSEKKTFSYESMTNLLVLTRTSAQKETYWKNYSSPWPFFLYLNDLNRIETVVNCNIIQYNELGNIIRICI